MKKILSWILFTICLKASGQVDRVLVLGTGHKLEVRTQLTKYALENNIELNFSEIISTENINNISAVFLWNFDDNQLDIRQNNLLVNFLKNQGGLMACGNSVKEKYRWSWIGNTLGFRKTPVNEVFSGEIITLKSLGNTGQVPIWTLSNAHLTGLTPAKYLKPVLMDFNGKNLAWTGKTEAGGGVFYSVFEPDTFNLKNPDFRNHLIAGLRSALNTKLQTQKIESTLPLEHLLKIDTLGMAPVEANSLLVLPNNSLLLISKNDSVYYFIPENGQIENIGFPSHAGKALGYSIDPDFSINSSIYAYFKDSLNSIFVKKLKFEGQIKWDDFESPSSLPEFNSFILKPDSIQSDKMIFPEYYFGKRIYLNSENGISVDTYDQNFQVIATEPFILNTLAGKIKAVAFSSFGIMYLISNEYFLRLEYNNEGKFMPMPQMILSTIIQKSGSVKVDLRVKNYMPDCRYLWLINDKKYEGEKVNILVKRKSILNVSLKAIAETGLTKTAKDRLEIN